MKLNNNRVGQVANITIGFKNVCWRCGTTEDIDKHHVIPRRFNPIYNIKVPLCKKCHYEMHEYHGLRKKMMNRLRCWLNWGNKKPAYAVISGATMEIKKDKEK